MGLENRIAADPVALHELDEHDDTNGELIVPLITLHTRLDQQAPYFHETIYTIKNIITGSYLNRRFNIPIQRFGHCNFTEGEAIFAFAVMTDLCGRSRITLEGLRSSFSETEEKAPEDFRQPAVGKCSSPAASRESVTPAREIRALGCSGFDSFEDSRQIKGVVA